MRVDVPRPAEPHPPTQRCYEIGFDGDVADRVLELLPAAVVTDLPTCTILWSRGRRPDELDTLLDTLLGLGITPREVHESAGGLRDGSGPGRYCEIRLNGSLGAGMLRYLGWSHRVTKSTVVKLWISQEKLRTAMLQLASVARVDYVLAL